VGFANISHLFGDPQFVQALEFTLKYAVAVTVLQVGLGLGLALLYTFYLRRGSALLRTLVFFPVVIPTVAVAGLFSKMFAIVPQYGLVNSLFNAVGWHSQVKDWLGYGGSAFLVIVLMDVWRSMGFYAVLLYAGLVNVPEELIESARLDGASGVRLVKTVVLPLLYPVLFSALIFSINGTLKVFDSILALTSGGPGQATTPLTLYMFNTAFSYGQYGYASAIASALAMICLVITVAMFGFARRDLTE
jgi:ABC-type sugar transport system permease subunit